MYIDLCTGISKLLQNTATAYRSISTVNKVGINKVNPPYHVT